MKIKANGHVAYRVQGKMKWASSWLVIILCFDEGRMNGSIPIGVYVN